MTRYGMVIDLAQCIGCHTCAVACKQANNVPEGIFWNRIGQDGGIGPDTSTGEFPNCSLQYVPLNCQHCENPACTKVCPVGATYKDPLTGVVRQDYDKCIGCRMCMAACPYTGIRSFNWDEPHYAVDETLGDAEAPKHQKHTVEKCTFCYQRISKGETPACMVLCPGRARRWGDFDDPDSNVSKLLREREWKQLLPEKGTKPNVYFLV